MLESRHWEDKPFSYLLLFRRKFEISLWKHIPLNGNLYTTNFSSCDGVLELKSIFLDQKKKKTRGKVHHNWGDKTCEKLKLFSFMKLIINNIHFEEGINSSFEPEIDLKSHVEEVGF